MVLENFHNANNSCNNRNSNNTSKHNDIRNMKNCSFNENNMDHDMRSSSKVLPPMLARIHDFCNMNNTHEIATVHDIYSSSDIEGSSNNFTLRKYEQFTFHMLLTFPNDR